MCTVQNPALKMLSWKDRVMASVENPQVTPNAPYIPKTSTSPEVHCASKQSVPSRAKGMNGVQKNDTSHAMRRKKPKQQVPRQNMLNSMWSLYYHNPTSDDWSNKSYQKMSDITSVESFCAHSLNTSFF